MTEKYTVEYQKANKTVGLYGASLYHPCTHVFGHPLHGSVSRCNRDSSYTTFERGTLSGHILVSHLCKAHFDELVRLCPDINFVNLDVLKV